MRARTTVATLAAVVGAAALLALHARAQEGVAGFPNRTITLFNYAAAGGPVDVMARLLAEGVRPRLGKPVVVENRTGAAGVTATLALKNAPPDGHTLLYGGMTNAILAPQIRNPLPYDSRTDAAPIALTIGYPMQIVVHPSVPAKTIDELVAYAKANPRKLNIGSNGYGAWTHVSMELFMERMGIDMVRVPYTGNAPAAQALLAGDIQVVVLDVNTVIQHIRSGAMRAIAQFGSEPAPGLEDVPMLDSVPELKTDFWLGVFAPPGTPAPIVGVLNREINAFMTTPEMRKKATDLFMRVRTGTPEDLAKLVDHDWVTWGKVIRDNNIVVK